jgi:exopolysaccharide production protein ExoZ
MSGKLGNLQALRGAACLYVVLYHVGGWEKLVTYAPKPFFRVFTYSGFAGVDLFFVISGFILTWINWDHLGRPRRLPAHLFKRAWRVYPVMGLAWVIMVGCFLGITDRTLGQLAAELPQALLLLPPPDGGTYLVLPHAWTLAYEVMFYAVFAVAFVAPRGWFVPLACAWAGACTWYAVAGPAGAQPLPADYALRPFVLEFLAGCGVAVLIKAGVLGGARAAVAVGLAWFLAGTVLEAVKLTGATTSAGQRVLLFGPPSALLVYGLVAREQVTGRTLPGWLRKTGDASYSIYLFHYPVLFAVTFLTLHWGHRTKPHLVWAVLTVGGGIAAGFLAHHLAEKPLLALPGWVARKLAARHRPGVVAAPGPVAGRRAA